MRMATLKGSEDTGLKERMRGGENKKEEEDEEEEEEEARWEG